MIVFHFPVDPRILLVKRLIGLPGDRLHLNNGDLILNSNKIVEKYVVHAAGVNVSAFFSNFPMRAAEDPSLHPYGKRALDRYGAAGELVIPGGGYFVMGDNRDYSYDSRSWRLITPSDIVGLVREIVSSEDPKTKSPRPNRVHLAINAASPRGIY